MRTVSRLKLQGCSCVVVFCPVAEVTHRRFFGLKVNLIVFFSVSVSLLERKKNKLPGLSQVSLVRGGALSHFC